MFTHNYSRNQNYEVARDMGGEEPTKANERDDIATSRDEAEHRGQEHQRQRLIDRWDGQAPTLDKSRRCLSTGRQIGRGHDAHGRGLVGRLGAGGELAEEIAEGII